MDVNSEEMSPLSEVRCQAEEIGGLNYVPIAPIDCERVRFAVGS